MTTKYELIQSGGGTGPMKPRQPLSMQVDKTVLIPVGCA